MQVFQQALALRIQRAGELHKRAGVSGHELRHVAVHREPQGDVVLGERVLDLARFVRHRVQAADEPHLHFGGEPGEVAARDAGRRAELVRVADHLHDRPHGDAATAVVAVHLHAPHVPPAAVGRQVVAGDGDELPRGRGAAGESEHQHAVVGQQGVRVAGLHLLDVRGDVLVRRDRHVLAEVVGRANRAEVVIAAEPGVRLLAEDAVEDGRLHGPRVVALPLEPPQLPPHRPRNQPPDANEEESLEGHASTLASAAKFTTTTPPASSYLDFIVAPSWSM